MRFWVKVYHNFFSFYTYDEEAPGDPIKPWKEVANSNSFMDAEDHVHVKGSTGLFTNGAKDCTFDFIFIQPLACTEEKPL